MTIDQSISSLPETDSSSSARYRSLVVATGQIVWTNSPNGEMLGEQPGWGEFTGQTFEQYQQFGWAGAVHPDDRQPTIDAWNEAVRTRGVFAFEHRVRRRDGVYRHFSIRAVPVLNDDGSIREWVGVHTDITDHLERQQALRESEEKYRILAEMLPILVWTAKPDGDFDFVSPSFTTLSNRRPHELMKDGWYSLAHPSDLPEVTARWRKSLATGVPFDAEARLLRARDQKYRWHHLRAVPMRAKSGAVSKWIGSGADIDDQKRSTEVREAALAQVKAERERLTRIFMNAPAVMAIYRGRDYVIDLVNPMWEVFVGRKNVLGKKVREVFPELEGQGIFEIIDRVRDTATPFTADELRVLLDRKGTGVLEETFWRAVFQPLAGPDGSTVDIVVHATEITELVRARRLLADAGLS